MMRIMLVWLRLSRLLWWFSCNWCWVRNYKYLVSIFRLSCCWKVLLWNWWILKMFCFLYLVKVNWWICWLIWLWWWWIFLVFLVMILKLLVILICWYIVMICGLIIGICLLNVLMLFVVCWLRRVFWWVVFRKCLGVLIWICWFLKIYMWYRIVGFWLYCWSRFWWVNFVKVELFVY